MVLDVAQRTVGGVIFHEVCEEDLPDGGRARRKDTLVLVVGGSTMAGGGLAPGAWCEVEA